MPEPTGTRSSQWPSLRVDDWTDTRDTLHMWLQIVGKVRLAHAPLINHWLQSTLYVSPRGLTTTSIPYGTGVFDLELDFVEHQLLARSSSGESRTVTLGPKSVAEFHAQTLHALDQLGRRILAALPTAGTGSWSRATPTS